MDTFEIIGPIAAIETIATGSGIRDLRRLRRLFGQGNWRKLKGIAQVRFPEGSVKIKRVMG